MAKEIILNYLTAVGWGMVATLSFVVAMIIVIKIYDWITPEKLWDEIKAKNVCTGAIVGALIIGLAIVIAVILKPNVPQYAAPLQQQSTNM